MSTNRTSSGRGVRAAFKSEVGQNPLAGVWVVFRVSSGNGILGTLKISKGSFKGSLHRTEKILCKARYSEEQCPA
jgi:hypothetical protein